jgi:hypothetical protein
MTAAACVMLPFLMPILRNIFSIGLNDTSVEAFQRYKTHLVPARDLFLYLTLALCIITSNWTFYNYWKGKRISKLELLVSLIFLIIAGLIIFVKTILPSGRLV